MKILDNLDLGSNQLLNAKLQTLASDITAAGNTGVLFYNSTTSLARISNGTSIDTLTNILESVTGTGAIQVGGVTGKSQQISVLAASGSQAGTLSAADYTLLHSATNTNTGSALVQRDASGNFAAGTITASLTGTASNASALNNQAASYYLNFANTTGTRDHNAISDFDTQVRTSRLDQMAAPTAAVPLNGQKISGLADPTNAQDAATKAYVDATTIGLDVKASVRAASTANVAVTYNATGGASGRGQITAAPNALDGVTLVVGNRVLLKDQTAGAQNGIYVVSTLGSGSNGVWDRAADFDADAEVTGGAFMFVEEGTVNDNVGYVLTTNNPITIGGGSGTALTFAQFSAAGTILAGNGLTKNGSTLSAVGTSGRISVSGTGIDIDSTYVGQTSITTLGVVGTGTWQGTAVAVTYGGTGATSATAARANLGALGRYTQVLSTSSTSYAVTHNLNTTYVNVVVKDNSTGAVVLVDWIATDANNVTVNFATAPTANAYNVMVVG